AIARTLIDCGLAVHVSPPSVLRKTPTFVPASSATAGRRSSAAILKLPSPALTAVHVPPPSVVRNTPPVVAPAHSAVGVVGSPTSERTCVSVIPVGSAVQSAP